jgi:uncharacterized protein
MEEILASIRRIISDDDGVEPITGKAAGAKPALKPAPAPVPARSIRDANRNGDGGAARHADIDATAALEPGPGEDPPGGTDGARQVPGRVDAPAGPEAHAAFAQVPDDTLLSPRTTAAVDTAFSSLAHTMLSQNPRTLEDLVRDMLKPMLKAWLDANLPDIVERLVRAEIERVSRRG